MRKVVTKNFRIATRSTSRHINCRIALNLDRENQPISRAGLARKMNVTRGVASLLVSEIIAEGLILKGSQVLNLLQPTASARVPYRPAGPRAASFAHWVAPARATGHQCKTQALPS
jgi:hypothetical protein